MCFSTLAVDNTRKILFSNENALAYELLKIIRNPCVNKNVFVRFSDKWERIHFNKCVDGAYEKLTTDFIDILRLAAV